VTKLPHRSPPYKAPRCRYGEEAGKATEKGMGIAVDAYDVYGAYRQVRITALAKAFVKGAITKEDAVEAGLPPQGAIELEPGVQLVEPLPHDANMTGLPPPGYVPPSSAADGGPGSAPISGATVPQPGGTAPTGTGAAPGATQPHPAGSNVPLGSTSGASAGGKPPHV
jgi:hypothetical protein